MNDSYSQPPGYPPQPGYPPPVRRKGMGCLAVGCIVVVAIFLILGAILGGLGWYTYRSVQPFISTQPVAVRTYPASQEQYTALLERLQKFWTAPDAGQTATLKLSADDVNNYIACAPEAKEARGKAFVSIVNDELIIESSFPLANDRRSSARGASYFVGKVTFVPSFEGGELNLALRKLETLDGKPAPGLVNTLVQNPDFIREFNRSISRSANEGLRKQTDRNANLSTVLNRIHTITVQNNQIVITATGGAPAPAR